MNRDFIYKNLEFVMTCQACPEQYDVFDLQNARKQVGYVRLRWGGLRCDFPDYGGETIHSYTFEDGDHTHYKGCFDTEEERKLHLGNIGEAILTAIHRKSTW